MYRIYIYIKNVLERDQEKKGRGFKELTPEVLKFIGQPGKLDIQLNVVVTVLSLKSTSWKFGFSLEGELFVLWEISVFVLQIFT